MLTELLKAEAAKRATVVSLAESIESERALLVTRLHDALRPHLETLDTLNLTGDYGRPVSLPSRQCRDPEEWKWVDHVLVREGLFLRLGSTISHEELRVSVVPRGPCRPEAVVHLQLTRHHPFKSDKATEFPGHTPADTVVEAFLSALMPHLHFPK